MEDNERSPLEDADRELEDQLLTVVKKTVPTLRVAKNLAKVLHRLSSIGSDTFVTALEAGKSWFQLKKARNEYLIAQLAELPKGQSAIGVQVAERLIKEQRRIDQLVFAAIEHVQTSDHSAPSEDGNDEIDDDWIECFRREAADRSLGKMRETFARILAGEIHQPGTFSIKTLRTVGALSQSTASLFRRAASLRVGMNIATLNDSGTSRIVHSDARIPSLGGDLGDNYLESEGLPYIYLLELTESGLLHHEYDSWHKYRIMLPNSQLKQGMVAWVIHQDQKWKLVPMPKFSGGSDLKIYGAKFTNVGFELLQIVDIEKDAKFLNKVHAFFKKQHLEMVEY